MARALLLQLFSFATALLATPPALSAEPPWRLLEAQHYRVVSQLNDRDTLAWSQQFDQFIAAMSGVLKINPAQLPPLTVVLFARDRGFEPYKPPVSGELKQGIAGLFARQATWSVIGLAGTAGNDALRQKILHEATHWLMSVDEGRRPAWFSEGIAEVLASFEIRDEQVIWGKPLESRLQWLDTGPVDLKQFLTLPTAIMDDGNSTAFFYAQSWAFTHFLLFSPEPSYQQLLPRFLQVYKTRSGPATLAEVFADGLQTIERDYTRYLKFGRFRYVKQPLAPVPALSAPVPAPAVLVEAALARLAFGSDQFELARQHANRAVQLDPAAPGGHELLAYLAAHDKSAEDLVAQAEAALRAGSKDSQLYVMLGDLLGEAPENERSQTRRQRVNLYESAINLNSRRAEPFEKLGESLFALPQPTTDDADFLALGMKIFPGDDWIRVGAAVVDFRLGRTAQAREEMARVLLPESTLDDDQRKAATGLLNGLLTAMAGPEPEEIHAEEP